jgi:uncharacterized protein YdeI (YjbR/CyaY-like superfamily)
MLAFDDRESWRGPSLFPSWERSSSRFGSLFIMKGVLAASSDEHPEQVSMRNHVHGKHTAMGKRDDRIDAYIAKSAEFARPILTHLREVLHSACPEVEETMKWSFPHFMYKGMLCSMAAFKEHCAFGFWKGALVVEKESGKSVEGAGQFGRITELSSLPSKKILFGYIKAAMKLNEDGVKNPARPKPKMPREVVVPDDLASALQGNKQARATFENFSPSHQREYVAWITEAKTEATRTKRLQTAVEWMAEGKARNWKYMNC